MATYTVNNLGEINVENSLEYGINQIKLGNYDSLLISENLAGEIFDFINLLTLSGTTIAITSTDGTITNLNGAITINSMTTGYGIQSNDYSERNITQSTGTVNVVGVNEAVGINGFFNTNSGIVAKNTLNFDEMALTLDIESTSDNAYGIQLSTSAFTRYRGSGISELSTNNIVGNITVNAGAKAYGIYTYGKGYLGNAIDSSSNELCQSIARTTINDISSVISVSGSTGAYGIYNQAEADLNYVTNTPISEIKITNISNKINAVATNGEAMGIYSSGLVELANDISGIIDVASTNGNAYGINARELSIANITGTISYQLKQFVT